jgi:hypothetical protein
MYLRLILTLGLFLLLAGCLPRNPAAEVRVEGKVTSNRTPAADVRVLAYPVTAETLDGASPYSSLPTAADGRFRLTLPAGEYYFFARGAGLFSFYGRNPVAVPAEGLAEMNLGLVPEGGRPPSDEPFVATGVLGRTFAEEGSQADATIYVYTDLTSRLKGMGYVMAGPTDKEGIFEAALPAGTYYLLARQRRGNSSTGPLQAGDHVGYYPGNPLTLKEGEVARVAIPMLEVPAKVTAMAGNLFGQTSIVGRILDRRGDPVAGVRAVLYDDGQMLNRPLYVSQPSGADGAFVLSFPEGGTYFLAARDTLGGAPGPGDLYGTYDASDDHSLSLETGEKRSGIDIVVEEMW